MDCAAKYAGNLWMILKKLDTLELVKDANNMTRITEIKAQIEAGGEGCVPYGSLSELLGLVEVMSEALERISKRPDLPNPDRDADWKNCMKWSSHEANEALAQFKAWNEVV